ncbi:hypothetical protein ACP4OV_031029 [Aristida adscensionis]
MASDGQLREWVSDRLMTLLGYSKSVVVQYVIRLAKECSSTGHLVGKLVEFGFTSSEETRTFAADIYAKNYQKQEREAAKLVQKQSTYQLLADDDDNDADNQTSTTRQSSANQASKSRKHFRRKAEDQDGGDDDNEKVTKDSGRNVRRKIEEDNEEDGDDSSDDEQERIRDQQERAQLEKNMRERDAANTRKLMERQLSKEEQGINLNSLLVCLIFISAKDIDTRSLTEELNRRSQAMDKNDTSDLRKYSRQAYLQKRRDKKIEEIRDEILDHEYIFDGVKLTEAEEEELRYKQRIYALVKDHVESADDIGEYKMPEAYDMGENVNQEKRFSVAMQRYKDPEGKDKMNPFAEQEAWEEHQIGKSKLQFGSKNRKRSSDDYQYVFEDGIDFVKSSVIEGTQDEDYSDQEDIDAKRYVEKGAPDERKTLPIYKFRDELLKAVEEYQSYCYSGRKLALARQHKYLSTSMKLEYTAKGKVRLHCTQTSSSGSHECCGKGVSRNGVKLGHEVGYSIRFEDCTSEKTIIKYMTDGNASEGVSLVNQIWLATVVMVDEAHERTLSTDILFGLVKDISRFRPDLKLLISSATLDAEKFSDYFDSAPIFKIPGRRYPVEIQLYKKLQKQTT